MRKKCQNFSSLLVALRNKMNMDESFKKLADESDVMNLDKVFHIKLLRKAWEFRERKQITIIMIL
ncbi:12523_t:CDS:1, partial [Racocetra persica]